MYNSTNSIKKTAKQLQEEEKYRAERRIRMLNNIEVKSTNRRLAQSKNKSKIHLSKSYTSKISIKYAPMDKELKIYHLLAVLTKNLGEPLSDPLFNMPVQFNTEDFIQEMFKYYDDYFTIPATKEVPKHLKVIPIQNRIWESYILAYPKIKKSIGLERWFHYFVYIKPGILSKRKTSLYNKIYIDKIHLEDIDTPLDNYEGYTEIEMYKHWIQCLRKNCNLLMEDKRASIPMKYLHISVFKAMQDNLEEWLNLTQEDKEKWFLFNKYYEKIQNSIGLESLLHYVIFKQPRILPKSKFKEYADTYHKVSARLAFKPLNALNRSSK